MWKYGMSLKPKGDESGLVAAEVQYLLPFRELHFTYLVDLKEVVISGLTKTNQGHQWWGGRGGNCTHPPQILAE